MSLFAFFIPGPTEILLGLLGLGVLGTMALVIVLALKKSR